MRAGLSQQTTLGVPTNRGKARRYTEEPLAGLSQQTTLGVPTNRGKARRYNGKDAGRYNCYSLRMAFSRKNIRLACRNYLGHGIYFITICTDDRAPRFADTSLGYLALGHLISLAARHAFLLHAYCLMPDHLHFLAEGNSPESDLLRFMTAFKQRTALAYKNRADAPLWQTKFYDHILRAPEELESVACYIWANPVRKGLCAEAGSYPLSGSQTLDWKKLSAHLNDWRPHWKGLVPGSARKGRGQSP